MRSPNARASEGYREALNSTWTHFSNANLFVSMTAEELMEPVRVSPSLDLTPTHVFSGLWCEALKCHFCSLRSGDPGETPSQGGAKSTSGFIKVFVSGN